MPSMYERQSRSSSGPFLPHSLRCRRCRVEPGGGRFGFTWPATGHRLLRPARHTWVAHSMTGEWWRGSLFPQSAAVGNEAPVAGFSLDPVPAHRATGTSGNDHRRAVGTRWRGQSWSAALTAAAGHQWVTSRLPSLLPVGMVKVQDASHSPREVRAQAWSIPGTWTSRSSPSARTRRGRSFAARPPWCAIAAETSMVTGRGGHTSRHGFGLYTALHRSNTYSTLVLPLITPPAVGEGSADRWRRPT